MSDNSSDTPTGIDDGLAEPSMEDILASIRRIIAEDDTADDGHVDVPVAAAIAGSPSDEFNSFDENPVLSDNSTEFDDVLVLEDTVETMDNATEVVDVSNLSIEDAISEHEFNPVSNVMSSLEEKLSLSESTDNLEQSEENDFEDLELTLEASDVELPGFQAEETGLTLEPEMEIETVEPEAATNFEASRSTSSTGDSDLDLVKSLMAELTDTSFVSDDFEPATEISADAETDEVDIVAPEAVESAASSNEISDDIDLLLNDLEQNLVEAETPTVDNDDLDNLLATPEDNIEEQEQILNDILDMAIQSEEDNNALENLDLTVDSEMAAPVVGNALLQIAEKAEADALNQQTENVGASLEEGESTEDILNELDQVLADAVDDETQSIVKEPEFENSVVEAEEETEEHSLEIKSEEIEVEADVAKNVDLFIENQEAEDMAKTARKDAILDEVTETAAADAFASLNQAVEENAIFTESGPRIGDLVQEALRPMLKEWLDDNLKSIVERAVAKEVKRISSGK